MRILAATLLSPLVLLAGCATREPVPSCEHMTVPAGAVFGVRHGVDTATYPPKMQRGQSGCQRVWHGNRQRPETMQVLATYYFEQGHVRRLVGQVPGGGAYDCHYRDGKIDAAASRNPALCPQASEVEAAN